MIIISYKKQLLPLYESTSLASKLFYLVIKMREMRGEVGKKASKNRWIIPYFYDVTEIKSRTDWASLVKLTKVLMSTLSIVANFFSVNYHKINSGATQSISHKRGHCSHFKRYFLLIMKTRMTTSISSEAKKDRWEYRQADLKRRC